jgi:DNA-binding transcriptional LysR family regulator
MWFSPYRALVVREFQRHKVPLNMDLEMPTIEAIRKMVQRNEGVAFLPRMVVEDEVQHGIVREVRVTEMKVDRPIRLVYPRARR